MESVIEAWLRGFVMNAGRPVRDDLHIDEIDQRFADPAVWSTAAVDCLVAAAKMSAANNWPITVAVEIFLRPSQSRDDPDRLRFRDIRRELGYTPPALTVYRHGNEPWTSAHAFKSVDMALENAAWATLAGRIYYQQWHDRQEGDYDRRLWLVAGAA
ncbi:MAG: hypothetical protein P8174_12110 [Gemmatimonadota bacterium]